MTSVYNGICSKCGRPLIKEYCINFPHGTTRAYLCRDCCPPEKFPQIWHDKDFEDVMYKTVNDLEAVFKKAEITIALATEQDKKELEILKGKLFELWEEATYKCRQYEEIDRENHR